MISCRRWFMVRMNWWKIFPSKRSRCLTLLTCVIFAHFYVKILGMFIIDVKKWDFCSPAFLRWFLFESWSHGLFSNILSFQVYIYFLCYCYCWWNKIGSWRFVNNRLKKVLFIMCYLCSLGIIYLLHVYKKCYP